MSGSDAAGQPISGMTQVEYAPGLLVPAVDMTAPAGLKNVAVQLSQVVAAAQAGATAGGLQPTTSEGDVAAAGTTQATATALTAQDSVVTECPPGAGVIATAAQVGAWCSVVNTTGEALLLYPLEGAQWNALGMNVPGQIAANGGSAMFKLFSPVQGYTR